MQTNNNYTTTHNTAERTMTLSMLAGIIVFVDFKNQLVITSRNGEVKDKKTFADLPTLADFEIHIHNTEKAANELNTANINE